MWFRTRVSRFRSRSDLAMSGKLLAGAGFLALAGCVNPEHSVCYAISFNAYFYCIPEVSIPVRNK
jgi:hypothetical protein